MPANLHFQSTAAALLDNGNATPEALEQNRPRTGRHGGQNLAPIELLTTYPQKRDTGLQTVHLTGRKPLPQGSRNRALEYPLNLDRECSEK